MTTRKKKPTKAPVDKPEVQEPVEPEAVATAPEVQDPVEPVKDPDAVPEAVPEADAAPDAAPQAEPEATTPEDPSEPTEPSAVHAKPFTAALRDPRLPSVGSVITRQYKGTTLEVLVTETGFEYNGETYSSISKVAAAVSGARAVNGFAFFKLGTVAGGKSPRSGAGTARLAAKINKIESLVGKLRQAVADGAQALAEAEADLTAMKEKADPKSE